MFLFAELRCWCECKPFCLVVLLARENMCCTDFARFHAWLKLCRASTLFLRPLPEQAPLPPWLIAGRHSRGDLASINRHEGNSPASNINTETGCAATEARPELVRAPQALRAPQRRLFNTQILLKEIWPRISLGCLICHEPRSGFTWSGQILKLMSDSNECQLSQSRVSVLYVCFPIDTLCLIKPHRGPSGDVCVRLCLFLCVSVPVYVPVSPSLLVSMFVPVYLSPCSALCSCPSLCVASCSCPSLCVCVHPCVCVCPCVPLWILATCYIKDRLCGLQFLTSLQPAVLQSIYFCKTLTVRPGPNEKELRPQDEQQHKDSEYPQIPFSAPVG